MSFLELRVVRGSDRSELGRFIVLGEMHESWIWTTAISESGSQVVMKCQDCACSVSGTIHFSEECPML